jgi:hypothetical protein
MVWAETRAVVLKIRKSSRIRIMESFLERKWKYKKKLRDKLFLKSFKT